MRLIYPRDAPWDPDQIWSFEHAVGTGSTVPWSWLGMMSSGDVQNPGMSLWIFVFLVRLFGITKPEQLSQAVAALSILAIALVGVWAAVQLRGQEREIWLIAGALAAVNPISIFLTRIIWAQSTLPLFALLFWFGMWNRSRWWGSLLWGSMAAFLGQVHLAGLFLAVGAAIWVLLFKRRETNWWGFGAGLVAVGWPLIPWIQYFVTTPRHPPHYPLSAHFPGKVWLWWLLSDSGLAVRYLTGNFWKLSLVTFLREPRILGVHTYGMVIVYAALTLVIVTLLGLTIARLIKKRANWKRERFIGSNRTDFLLRSALIAFAGLLTFLPMPIFVHYFLVAFPMGFVWIAAMIAHTPQFAGSRRRLIVAAMLTLQLAASITMAVLSHRDFGALPGSYGWHFPTQSAVSR